MNNKNDYGMSVAKRIKRKGVCTEGGTKKKKKGSAYQTISATHRVIICVVSQFFYRVRDAFKTAKKITDVDVNNNY